MWRLLALIALIAAVFVGGFVRLSYDPPAIKRIDAESAAQLTGCLARNQLNEMVTISRFDPALASVLKPLATSLAFVAPAAIPFAPVDPRIAEDLKNNPEKPLSLPLGTLVRVSRGEFTLKEGSAEIRRGNASNLLQGAAPVTFKEAPSTTYLVALDKVDVPAAPAGQRLLPAGTGGILSLGDPGQQKAASTADWPLVPLVPLQPITVRPWLEGTVGNVLPLRVSGKKGLSDLAIEARRPGMQFNSADTTLSGCAWTTPASYSAVGVTETEASAVGAARIVLALPSDLLPAFSRSFGEPIRIALVSGDSRYVAYGAFTAIDRGWGGGLALLIGAALLWACLNLRRVEKLCSETPTYTLWLAGPFVDSQRRASLSRFQIFFWTVITVWGLIYVFIVTGSLLNLTGSVLALLGIAGAGTLAARLADSRARTNAGSGAGSGTAVDFAALLSTKNEFDLLKLQLFVFTLLIGAYVVWRIADTGAFPELDANTLLLLGVSEGLYVGGKLAPPAPATGAGGADSGSPPSPPSPPAPAAEPIEQ